MRLPPDIHDVVSVEHSLTDSGFLLTVWSPEGDARVVTYFAARKDANRAADVLTWTLQDWRDA